MQAKHDLERPIEQPGGRAGVRLQRTLLRVGDGRGADRLFVHIRVLAPLHERLDVRERRRRGLLSQAVQEDVDVRALSDKLGHATQHRAACDHRARRVATQDGDHHGRQL